MKLHPFTNTCETFAHIVHIYIYIYTIKRVCNYPPTHRNSNRRNVVYESWLISRGRVRSNGGRFTAMIEFEIAHAGRIPDEEANHNRFDLYRIQISQLQSCSLDSPSSFLSFEKWTFFLSLKINLTRSLVTICRSGCTCTRAEI